MLKRFVLIVGGFITAAAVIGTSIGAQARSTRAPIVDACQEWGLAFCTNGGSGGAVSDIPRYLTGTAVFNENSPSGSVGQMLTVMINKSAPDAEHVVWVCPGSGYFGPGERGFVGCAIIGRFTTNKHGHGRFHWQPAANDGSPAIINGCQYDALVMNTSAFGTLLATPSTGDLFPCN